LSPSKNKDDPPNLLSVVLLCASPDVSNTFLDVASKTPLLVKFNKSDVLASLYYDIETNSRWTPYIGGGIGYTNLSTPSFSLNGFPTNSVNKGLFGWQAKVGVSYAMSYNSDIYVEGVYQGAGGYTSENLTFDAFNSFGGKIGFRYRFGARPVAAAPAPAPQPVIQPAPAPAPVFQPEPAPAPIRGLW
jgi:hypothetical protein